MTTSPTTTKSVDNSEDRISRGQLAYVCARNQSQAHSLLIEAIKASGLSQKQLARRTGIDEATVSRILRRPRNIELNTFSKLFYGASEAMLSFEPFYPEQPKALRVYFAPEISNQRGSAQRTFLFETKIPLKTSSLTKATTSTEGDIYAGLIVLGT